MALDRDEQVAASRSESTRPRIDRSDLRALRGDDFFVPPADRHYYLALAHLARGRLAEGRAELRAFLAEEPRGPYAARARDRLAAVPDGVDARELTGTDFDRAALARSLSPLRAEIERCLQGGSALLQIRLSREGAANILLTPVEEACVARATAPARKLLGAAAQVALPWRAPRRRPPCPPIDRHGAPPSLYWTGCAHDRLDPARDRDGGEP